ncbi:MAG: hypothetical protein II735_01830 [Clostridia bacterium]|nr:hypothetical protein [Clostridia bacterium]
MAAERETREEKAGGVFGNKERFLKLIVIVGLAGIALIFLSSLLKPKETAQTGDNLTAPEDALVNAESYREQLTRELGNMVASIEGAGRTKLMLTLDGTIRYLYAADSDIQTNERGGGEQQNTEKKSYLVVRSRDGSEQALTIGQVMPNVKGVLVICEGGDNERVVNRIKEAVSAAVHLSVSHICVLKLSE